MRQREIPYYAPLRGFFFDRERLLREIETHREFLNERSVIYKNGRSAYAHSQKLADAVSSAEKLLNINHYSEDFGGDLGGAQSLDTQLVRIEKDYSTFQVMNLTYLPEVYDSTWNIYQMVDGKKQINWHCYRKPWPWRFAQQTPYLQELVHQLEFEYVQCVRIVAMYPPAIGVIHVDSGRDTNQNYLHDGFASISLNVASGGADLVCEKDEKVYRLSADVFHFDDSLPHGVTEIREPRVQVRIFGKMPIDRYKEKMILDEAIW